MIQVHTHQITQFLLLRLYVKLNISTSNLLDFPCNLITVNDNFLGIMTILSPWRDIDFRKLILSSKSHSFKRIIIVKDKNNI